MTTTKITKRDRYTALIAILKSAEVVDTDLVEFCENEIALLDKKAAKAKETAAAKKTEVDPLTEAIKGALATLADDVYVTTPEVTAMVSVGDEDITTAKVSYRLSQLVKAGLAEKTEVTVSNAEGKNRKIAGYRLV